MPSVDHATNARAHRRAGLMRGLLVSARPRQWLKNALVFAAPAAAGQLDQPAVLGRTLLAAVAFVLASSAIYLINDIVDRLEDAEHPGKRHRPIASGAVTVGAARAAALLLVVAAIGVIVAVDSAALAVVLGTYVFLNAAYNLGLRAVPLLDIAIVASGFLLRALAGAAATDIPLSAWFLIVVSFGSLYVVASKRFAELRDLDGRGDRNRASLEVYSVELLREIRFTASAVLIVAYVLWAFENAAEIQAWWFEASIAPFVLSLYRYAMLIDDGQGEAPEELFLGDRLLQALALTWVATFGAGVYVV